MKGFTLIEVLIASSLLTVILSMTIIPFVNLQVFQQGSQISSDIDQNLQYLLNIMDKEIRSGSQPNINTTGSELELAFINQNDKDVTYTFNDTPDPNNFIRTVDGDTINYGSTDQFQIEDVAFDVEEQSSTSPGRVTISITAKPDVGRSDEQTIYVQSTTIMRNR